MGRGDEDAEAIAKAIKSSAEKFTEEPEPYKGFWNPKSLHDHDEFWNHYWKTHTR